MALSANLIFGDVSEKSNTESDNNSEKSNTNSQTYAIIDFRFHFIRHHDLSYPDENARCKCVEVTMYAPNKDNLSLYDWYIQGIALTGRIEFQLPATGNDSNETTTGCLYFTSAYCHSISLSYTQDVNSKRLLKLMFVAESIKIEDIVFPN